MTTIATTCTRPGCGGTIEGGYCDTCGLAAAPSPQVPPQATGSGSAAGSGPSSGSTGSGRTGSGRTGSGRTRGGSGRSSRGQLGAGLVEIPPVPARDPAAAVLTDPVVADSQP